jgi:hypothetical protein
MAFKVKTKNRNPINTKQTLDASHNEIIEQFYQDILNIPVLQEQIHKITRDIEQINKAIQKNNEDPLFCIKQQEIIWKLDDERNELTHKITQIKTSEEESKYLLKTGGILQKYYKIVDNEGEQNEQNYCTKKSTTRNNTRNMFDKKSVLDWFSEESVPKKELVVEEDQHAEDSDNSGDSECESEADFVSSDSPSNLQDSKSKLYNQYMSFIQKDFIEESAYVDKMDVCEVCNSELLLNQNMGTLICQVCGVQDFILIDSDKPSYKDPPKEMTSFCYKRINHLNEFLAQFQAKETTEIDEDIYNEILVEIKKERINNMAELTPEKLRIILRKIKRNDYYEHIPYIINQLNGLPPPVISPEVEEIIRNMFKEVQIPFDLYCPPKRKNFLSYNFVLYKFFELLELDEYLKNFQLLKSPTKLYQQDRIWKNICTYLSWEFIPSL